MKKASMVLGIIGGIFAILVSLLAMFGGLAFSYFTQTDSWSEKIEDAATRNDVYDVQIVQSDVKDAGFVGRLFFGLGVVIFITGILGIIGGAIVNRHNVAAGVLMLLGSAITLFTLWAFISFILLLLGGIFALIKDSSGNRLSEKSQAL